MLAKVGSNLDHYNMTKKMLRKIEKKVKSIYTWLMQGSLFNDYLDGLKDAIRQECGDALFKNKTFAEKYLEYIKVKIE